MTRYYYKGANFSLNFKKTTGGILILFGFLIFLYFLFPVISYQLFLASSLPSNLETPVPKYLVVNKGNSIESLFSQGLAALTQNYSDARNWYPKISDTISGKAKVDSYLLSIPKINVDDVQVSTTDYDLDHHLIQYLGTSIPGDDGTAVIFGHSTLPQLFDPKNYKTIFAYAHTLKVGDEVDATVRGIKYKYKIFSILITDPSDTNILLQSYDHSYITIVTCTPPGTTWKRLVIRAAQVSS